MVVVDITEYYYKIVHYQATEEDYFLGSEYIIKGAEASDEFNFAFAAINRDDYDYVLDPSYGSLRLVLQQRYFG